MDKNEAKFKILQSLINEDTVKKEEFMKNFEVVIEFAKKTKNLAENEIQRIENFYEKSVSEIKNINAGEWKKIKQKVDTLRDGIDGKDGLDGKHGIDGKDGRDGVDGQNGSPDTAEEIRNKLETLEGDERLDKSAIKGLDEAIEDVRKIARIPQNGGGSGGVAVFNSTGKVGSGSALKFVGSGVSSVSSDGHTSTITISGGGGGGAVDSVNGQTGVVVLDADDIDDTSTTHKFVTSTDITKLGNLSGTNSGDVTLTGEDYLSITGQQITANAIDLDNLSATGTPSSSTFLRGDNTWATPSGSGDVSKVGTPVDNQVGVWTGDGTIEGDANLTFDTATDTLTTVNIATSGDVTVADEAYGAGWNGSAEVPTKNAVYDKVETLVPYTGATANVDLGTYDLITDTITSKTSSGLILENNTGGDVLHIGNGGGVNATAFGGWNFDGATADTIASFGASKTLTSLATTTYPSLTELSYVKGVTSAIQTQLNAKGAGTVTSVTSANADIGVATTTTTPVMTLNSATTGTANSIVKRDANGLITTPNFIQGYTTTATAAGTTTLTVTSTFVQVFTGTTTQTITLPTTGVAQGQQFYIINRSTGLVTVQSSGANTIVILATNTEVLLTANIATPTTAANWNADYFGVNAASGKVATINHNLTFSGTDGTTMTFPSTSATIARTDAAQTFTGVQTMTSPSITTSIVTGSASFDAFNTTATTGNLFGAATTLTIGATTGTLNLRNVTLTCANATSFAMNGASPSITTTNTGTASVFNTGALTGNIFGAATTLTVGGTRTGAVTHNYSTNATATATTKTVNLGTGGAAGSTSNINIGASAGGTTTINSPTISLGGTTGATTTGTIELGAASDTTISRSAAGVIAVEGVVIPSISSTNTLTNKRITKRTGTTTSSATPTINTDNVDFYSITAQTVDITSFTTNLSGTPTEGQTLWIAITGTAARAITWGSSFEASTVALPTTTVSTNRLDVGFVWNSVSSKWRCVASA